jgi:hypothetical protein
MSRRISWTKFRAEQARRVQQICKGLQEYWPLTLRQVFYQLVNVGMENSKSKYTDLSQLVKFMRLDNYLSWKVIQDESRTLIEKRGFTDAGEFVQQEMECFLDGYTRCLVSDQEKYVEVWCEKHTLRKIIERAAWPYCVRCVFSIGFQSTTFLHEYRVRANKAIELEQIPVILYLGDFDPSGLCMLDAIEQSLKWEMDLPEIEVKRIGLNWDQVEEYNLPANFTAIKKGDTRAKKFREQYGDHGVELDALHPETLKKIVEHSIMEKFDMTLFFQQKEIEEVEQEKIERLRSRVEAMIREEVKGCLTSQTL